MSKFDKQESNEIKVVQQKQMENVQQPGNIIHISTNPGNRTKTTINDNHTVQDKSSIVVEKILNDMKIEKPIPDSINLGLNTSKERNKKTTVNKENNEELLEKNLGTTGMDNWIFNIGK